MRLSTLGEMASGIAHEINQPLTAIATYAQAARRLVGRPDHHELDQVLGKIVQQAERAAAVIKRLRAFVRQQDAEQELVEPNDLVREVVQFLEMDALRRGIPVQAQWQSGLRPVLADRVQLQQVLLNLVLNAMDASETAGSVSPVEVIVRPVNHSSRIQFEVMDLGSGVSEAARPLLFSPFFTTKPSGLGMGLSICRSIIEMHGGELRYEPRPERGSRFWFSLPAVAPEMVSDLCET
jgi:two-component system sensor kinase FixL